MEAALTPVAGSVFGQLSQTHFSKSESKNSQISKSCIVFQVIQDISLAKFLCKFSGGATFEKHADLEKMNRNSRKSRANSRNLLEPFLRSRKEENLYWHCAINNARRILSKGTTLLRSCCFWSKKLSFSKEFRSEFQCGGEGQLHFMNLNP